MKNDSDEEKMVAKAQKQFAVVLMTDNWRDDLEVQTFDTFKEASHCAKSTTRAMAIFKRTHITHNTIEEK